MKRLKFAAPATLALALLAATSTPAAAQDTGGEKINQVIVFGDDPCPQSSGDEITVCARKDEGERFRIPEVLRGAQSPQNEAWNNKVLAYETVGREGIMSCSPVGAGGSLGCTQRLVDAAYAEKRESGDVRFSQMIEAEREKRLATIDAEAEATQKRVEEAERAYEERQRGAEAASVP